MTGQCQVYFEPRFANSTLFLPGRAPDATPVASKPHSAVFKVWAEVTGLVMEGDTGLQVCDSRSGTGYLGILSFIRNVYLHIWSFR